MTFPAEPDIDDEHTENGRRFVWNGVAWRCVSGPARTVTPYAFTGSVVVVTEP